MVYSSSSSCYWWFFSFVLSVLFFLFLFFPGGVCRFVGIIPSWQGGGVDLWGSYLPGGGGCRWLNIRLLCNLVATLYFLSDVSANLSKNYWFTSNFYFNPVFTN